jgi:hypothetical protein
MNPKLKVTLFVLGLVYVLWFLMNPLFWLNAFAGTGVRQGNYTCSGDFVGSEREPKQYVSIYADGDVLDHSPGAVIDMTTTRSLTNEVFSKILVSPHCTPGWEGHGYQQDTAWKKVGILLFMIISIGLFCVTAIFINK